jgi:hypothetical protein
LAADSSAPRTARGMDRIGDQRAQATGFEGLDRGLGGAVRRGHPAAQFGGIDIGFGQHPRGTQDGLQGERARGVARQAFADAGIDHRLGQQEHVGRAAAGDRGDRVHLRFVVDPHGLARGREQRLGEIAALRIHALAGEQAGHAGPEQGRACSASSAPPPCRPRASAPVARQ